MHSYFLLSASASASPSVSFFSFCFFLLVRLLSQCFVHWTFDAFTVVVVDIAVSDEIYSPCLPACFTSLWFFQHIIWHSTFNSFLSLFIYSIKWFIHRKFCCSPAQKCVDHNRSITPYTTKSGHTHRQIHTPFTLHCTEHRSPSTHHK